MGHAVEGGAHYHPIAAWIPSRDSVDAMVRFHSEVTILNYDGICKQHDIYIIYIITNDSNTPDRYLFHVMYADVWHSNPYLSAHAVGAVDRH